MKLVSNIAILYAIDFDFSTDVHLILFPQTTDHY
jgi:hypothetical protein